MKKGKAIIEIRYDKDGLETLSKLKKSVDEIFAYIEGITVKKVKISK